MRENIDTRRPEEIESDIERTRADFSSTIEAIQNKLTPSELVDQAVDYALATKPGAFSASLINSVRANPIPVALIGVGVAWLMAATRQPGERVMRSRHQRRASSTIYYPDMDSPYTGTAEAGYLTGAGSTSSSEGLLHRAATKTSETGRVLKDKASDVGHRLGDSASMVSEHAQRLGQTAQTRLHESAESARARMNALSQRSQEEYYRAKDRVSHMIDEQPLVVGALGIAIGAAIGATLPTTRRENELMGTTRDDLMGRAKETALEQVETVKQSAQRVAQAAKDEAVRVKDDVMSSTTASQDQTRPVSPASMDSTQFGGMAGQQRPH